MMIIPTLLPIRTGTTRDICAAPAWRTATAFETRLRPTGAVRPKIFGDLRIGIDVAIRANAAVTMGTPDNAVVVGVLAPILKQDPR